MTIVKKETKCECSLLRRNHKKFQGWNDFDQFKRYLEESGLFAEVTVENKLYNVGGMEENWFQCSNCNTKWRLIEPDPPYAGQWQRVEDV